MFCWRLPPAAYSEIRAALNTGNCAVATQSWSRRGDGSAGSGNKIMAWIARRITNESLCGCPIIAQEEVAGELGRESCAFVAGGSADGRSTVSWNTAAIAELQANYCKSHNIQTVILVAGPFHQGRSKWCYERHGLRVLVAPRYGWRLSDYQDRQLVHWVAQGPERLPIAWARELLTRIWFVFKGWN